jgi:hypothetical protein
MVLGVEAFDGGGQLRQPFQGLTVALGLAAADGVHDLGQFLFILGQQGGDLPRCRQCQQRKHAVGFDLQQALRQSAAAAWRDCTAGDDEPGEAVGMDAQVGIDARLTVGDFRCDERIGVEHGGQIVLRPVVARVVGKQGDVVGADQCAGNGFAPRVRNVGAGAMPEPGLLVGRQPRSDESVGREFSMALPAQTHRADIGDVKTTALRGEREMMVFQQPAQMHMGLRLCLRVCQVGHVADLQRREQVLVRPGVDFVVQLLAQYVFMHGCQGAEEKCERHRAYPEGFAPPGERRLSKTCRTSQPRPRRPIQGCTMRLIMPRFC